jgi:hypothetical protein
MKFPSKCRICHHSYHVANCTIAYYEFGDDSEPTYKCTCKEYLPSDNLEYLEWKYDQRRKSVFNFFCNFI